MVYTLMRIYGNPENDAEREIHEKVLNLVGHEADYLRERYGTPHTFFTDIFNHLNPQKETGILAMPPCRFNYPGRNGRCAEPVRSIVSFKDELELFLEAIEGQPVLYVKPLKNKENDENGGEEKGSRPARVAPALEPVKQFPVLCYCPPDPDQGSDSLRDILQMIKIGRLVLSE